VIPAESRHGRDIAGRAWHDSYVPVVFLITIVAVLVGIFFAATGRGGELAYEQADQAPLDLGPVSAADVALLRPPTALWGYNMQVTDAALDQIARAVRERDVTIAYLQEQLASFERNGSYSEYSEYSEPRGARARQAAGLAPVPGLAGLPEAPAEPDTLENPQLADTLDVSASADTLDDLPRVPTSGAEEPGGPLDDFLRVPTPEAEEPGGPLDDFLRVPTPEAEEPGGPLDDFLRVPTPEAQEPAGTPEAQEPAGTPEAQEPAGTPRATETQGPPRTPLILRASPAKAPPPSEPHEATQPSEALRDPDEVTQPSEIHDLAQPPAPEDAVGPQGDFSAHDWWAEQREAARQEDPGSPAGTGGGHADDPAAAEEQGW
jgi:hypothetical protein